MNTTQIKPTPPATSGGDVGGIGIIIDVPPGTITALCLAGPLRYIFAKALGGKLSRTPLAAPLADGVGLMLSFASMEHLQAGVEIVRGELVGLGYESVAHVGVQQAEGWRCVHGNKDRIRLFENLVLASIEALNFNTQVYRAHLAAVSRQLES